MPDKYLLDVSHKVYPVNASQSFSTYGHCFSSLRITSAILFGYKQASYMILGLTSKKANVLPKQMK